MADGFIFCCGYFLCMHLMFPCVYCFLLLLLFFSIFPLAVYFVFHKNHHQRYYWIYGYTLFNDDNKHHWYSAYVFISCFDGMAHKMVFLIIIYLYYSFVFVRTILFDVCCIYLSPHWSIQPPYPTDFVAFYDIIFVNIMSNLVFDVWIGFVL